MTTPTTTERANLGLLSQAQEYLAVKRRQSPAINGGLEAAWLDFYNFYSVKIRKFAFTCGASQEDLADCAQDVWTELVARLPDFQLDLSRGQFDTWLFRIVRSKTIDLHRARKRRLRQENGDTLQSLVESGPCPAQKLADQELISLAWQRLRQRLSECSFQVLHMRLVEERSVAEVAKTLGLSHMQVSKWYHRARREAEEVGRYLGKEMKKNGKSAEENSGCSVSHN
jgi:RNA polymerase sigma factor (sigma-70 family)